MKAKRLIAFALAAVFMLSAAATPVFAAAALPQENAALEQQNDMVSIRLKATGDLVYGSNYKLEVQTCRYPVYRCCGGRWRRSEWLCDAGAVG